MTKAEKPEYIDLTPREADELVARISDNNLSNKDLQLLKVIVMNYLWVVTKLKEGALKIRTLSNFLLGFRSEKVSTLIKTDSNNKDKQASNENSLTKKPGHGRNSASKYNAKEVVISVEDLKAGDLCPEENCDGRLYQAKPSTLVRITAKGLFEATSYVLEGLRCALCGTIFRASLPISSGKEKYSKEAISWLGFYKYYAGLPFKRIETIQNLSGIPLPDATQWSLMCGLQSSIEPVYNQLMQLSGEASILHTDDTGCQILELEPDDGKRKAQYTTGVVSLYSGHIIHLFMSGSCYAGEKVSKLLSSRASNDALIYMADAHSMNNLKKIGTSTISKLIVVYCLVHARRQFANLIEIFSEEVKYVLKLIAKVYANDKYCRDYKFSNEQRQKYHEKHSPPILNEWKVWLLGQDKLTEPNSSLGKAINYVLKRWDQLTEFTRTPGCPMDNNIVEQALRIPIRLRKSAYFYKTANGALVGDSVMSLVYTCIAAKQNPIEYCTALQQNASAVKQNPDYWLPWNFKDQLQLAA